MPPALYRDNANLAQIMQTSTMFSPHPSANSFQSRLGTPCLCPIPALDRATPLLPLRPELPERQTHDYKRYATTTLFVAFNIMNGKVIGKLSAASTVGGNSLSSTAQAPGVDRNYETKPGLPLLEILRQTPRGCHSLIAFISR